jgi:hypothetical protein
VLIRPALVQTSVGESPSCARHPLVIPDSFGFVMNQISESTTKPMNHRKKTRPMPIAVPASWAVLQSCAPRIWSCRQERGSQAGLQRGS